MVEEITQSPLSQKQRSKKHELGLVYQASLSITGKRSWFGVSDLERFNNKVSKRRSKNKVAKASRKTNR